MSLQVEDAQLRHLLEAERTDRGLRSIRNQMHAARFPVHRDLAGFGDGGVAPGESRRCGDQ